MLFLKACGGSGKKFDIPPTDFVPQSLSIENKCVKCNAIFDNNNSAKNHIKIEHKEDVKKDRIYMDWLNKPTSVDSKNDVITISKLQQANRILTDKLNLQSEKEYTMVKENNGISEMQRKMLEFAVESESDVL